MCKQVKDFWTPSDQSFLDNNDLDFGSAVPVPVLNDEFLFVGGKEGSLYLLNANALGGYNASNRDANAHAVVPVNPTDEPGTNGIYRRDRQAAHSWTILMTHTCTFNKSTSYGIGIVNLWTPAVMMGRNWCQLVTWRCTRHVSGPVPLGALICTVCRVGR